MAGSRSILQVLILTLAGYQILQALQLLLLKHFITELAVTCGGNTQYSTPVLLTVTPGLPGGTYTIDPTQPASATNFISFNAAKDAMACGITGPVVFNVEPGTGLS